LHQVVGRQAGSIPGFNYSAPHKNSGITWSKEKLFQYLEDPRRVIPGNKMIFAGIPDPQKRADLIAWLETK
jgi:cytochrome c